LLHALEEFPALRLGDIGRYRAATQAVVQARCSEIVTGNGRFADFFAIGSDHTNDRFDLAEPISAYHEPFFG
jgi:hypothetical protein